MVARLDIDQSFWNFREYPKKIQSLEFFNTDMNALRKQKNENVVIGSKSNERNQKWKIGFLRQERKQIRTGIILKVLYLIIVCILNYKC